MTSFWNATVEMWDFHRDIIDGRGHECSHYCFGGVPQVRISALAQETAFLDIPGDLPQCHLRSCNSGDLGSITKDRPGVP